MTSHLNPIQGSGKGAAPFAYYVYMPDEQRGEFFHSLDEATDELTNNRCEVTKLFDTPQAVALPALNEDLIDILGRPNFVCAQLAQVLRAGGHEIKTKAEHEQAAVLHFLLGHYLNHGDQWHVMAQAEIRTMLEAAQAEGATS